MITVTLSRGELDFLKETLELVIDEFNGIAENTEEFREYVLTTGAYEQVLEANALITAWYNKLQEDDLKEVEK